MIFYSTEDSNNTINKTLVELGEETVQLSSKIDEDNFSFIVETGLDLESCNYIFVNTLGYFFVIDSDFLDNNFYRFTVRIDVLMTYKEEILNSTGRLVTHDERDYSNSLVNQDIRKETQIYKGDSIIDPEGEIILVTLGYSSLNTVPDGR